MAVFGKSGAATDDFEEAIALIETIRRDVRNRQYRMSFLGDDPLSVYNKIVIHLLDLQQPADAIHYVERARGRVYIEQLAETTLSHPQVTDEQTLSNSFGEVDRLTEQLRQLQARLEKASNRPKPKLAREMSRRQEMLNALIERIQRLPSLPEASRTVKEYIDLRRGLPLAFEEVRSCLKNV